MGNESYNEMKARTIQLRKDIFAVVKEHGKLTAYQIARLLNVSNMSISSTCVGLVNAGYLDNGPLATSESKNTHKVLTFVVGPITTPIPDEYQIVKKCYYQPRPKAERVPTGNVIKPDGITAEDHAWMEKYKLQRQQRYARFGEALQ